MTHYCAIYFTPDPETGKARRHIFLRIEDDKGGRFLKGIEVNREGDEIVPPGADNRLHIIDRKAIANRICMYIHPKYAVLRASPWQKGHGA